MKTLGILLLVLGLGAGGFFAIRDYNQAVLRAAGAYRRADYEAAIYEYQQALRATTRPDEAVVLNLAHAAMQAGRPALARTYYRRLLRSADLERRSTAQLQLANLLATEGQEATALQLLRQALLTNPNNATARYNYELLARRRQQSNPPPLAPPPAADVPPPLPPETSPQPRTTAGSDRQGQRNDPQRQDAQQPPQPGGRGGNTGPGGTTPAANGQPGHGPAQNLAQGSRPGASRGVTDRPDQADAAQQPGTEQATEAATDLQTQQARLRQLQLTPGQARQLLEALRATEQQYLQQLPRRPARPRTPPGKPTW